MSDPIHSEEREQRIREGLQELLDLLRKFKSEKSAVLEPDHPFLRLVETFICFLTTSLKHDLSLPRRARSAVGNAMEELGRLATSEEGVDGDANERLETARRILAEWVV